MSKFVLTYSGGFTTFSHPDYRDFSVHDSELPHLAAAVGSALTYSLYGEAPVECATCGTGQNSKPSPEAGAA